MEIAVLVLYFVALTAAGIYGFHRAQLVYLFFRHRHKSIEPPAQFTERPMLTIQLPMFNELFVAERLLDAIAKLNYPKDRMELQVLDDSTDETTEIVARKVEELRAQGFDIAHIHRTDRSGYKAGALEQGMKVAKGDFLMVFDADFVPSPEIVEHLIHHFTDPKVGMVQARWEHLNRDYSMLTRAQSLMLDGHFVIDHIARNRSGRFFNFNGTAGIWRKTAIIDAGGWQHDTITEDMDLSFRAQMRGWRFVYVPEAVAPAEVPCEMNSFKGQQFRWAKGSAQTTKKLLPIVLKAKLPWRIKMEAIFHLTNNFAYLFLVVLACLQLPNMILRKSIDNPMLLLLDVPLFLATSVPIILFYLSTNQFLYKTWWDAARRLPFMMALGIGLSLNNSHAVIEGLMSRDAVFVRTAKHGVTKRSDSWKKKNKSYLAPKNIATVLELLFGLYFAATIGLAAYTGAWLSIPFLTLFMVGFLYVGVLSLYQAR